MYQPILLITHKIYKSIDDGIQFSNSRKIVFGNLLHILYDFLSNKNERVVLNGPEFGLDNIHAGVLQESTVGLLLNLIYINDLADDLFSNVKFSADDTSLFSIVHDVNASVRELNDDLKNINKCAFHWKMSFHPDPSKQTQEIIFSRKIK